MMIDELLENPYMDAPRALPKVRYIKDTDCTRDTPVKFGFKTGYTANICKYIQG